MRPAGADREVAGLMVLLAVALGSACAAMPSGSGDPPPGRLAAPMVVQCDGVTATVIPEPGFAASRLETLFSGEHYRDLWTTPITVPVLSLSTYAGGLTPLKAGGGRQTRSLHLQASDGRRFVLRTVAKDQRNVLPAALRATIVGDIVQDQVSAVNPAGALVVAELAAALGVLHARPSLVLVPDDERLGAYRPAFAGVLGLLEEYPDAGGVDSPGFAGAAAIVSTARLFKNLDKDSNNRADPRSYLTARLLDMFVGDWDRHADQWRWARFAQDGRDVYQPIPRDRDQAFARLDGLFPWLVDVTNGPMEGFAEQFGDVEDLMHTGRAIDRRILVDLDQTQWDTVASGVVLRLTDEVIDRAVRRLPQPYYELRGAWLAAALAARRAQLSAVAAAYYRHLSLRVDIHLSDKSEQVEVERPDARHVTITAYRRDKHSGGLKGAPVYRRTFDAGETAQVRLFLHGGDDRIVGAGAGGSQPVVCVVDGGADQGAGICSDAN